MANMPPTQTTAPSTGAASATAVMGNSLVVAATISLRSGQGRPSERADAEVQPLRDVVVGFAGGDGVIDVQRAERRSPDQACSDRRADGAGIGGGKGL